MDADLSNWIPGDYGESECVVTSFETPDSWTTIIGMDCETLYGLEPEEVVVEGMVVMPIPSGTQVTVEMIGCGDAFVDCATGFRVFNEELGTLVHLETSPTTPQPIADVGYGLGTLEEQCQLDMHCNCDFIAELGLDVGGEVLRSGEDTFIDSGRYHVGVRYVGRWYGLCGETFNPNPATRWFSLVQTRAAL